MGQFYFLTTMYTRILISQLLFIYVALPASFEPTESDLECFNDYDTEMECHMTANNCTEYKLISNVSNDKDNKSFSCGFQPVPSNNCECKIKVSSGFVVKEIFVVNLWRSGKFLFAKTISILKSIKPKRPTIISVNLTKNGNFNITWDTHYTSPTPERFSKGLRTELIYGIYRSTENSTQVVPLGRTEYEIVGTTLQPNSKYFVKARVSTDYNNNSHFSKYSQPYEFSTPTSIQDIFKIIIPISCVILITFIPTLFYCCIKLKRELWDTFPTPKIASSFKKQTHILFPLENAFSSLHVENSSLDLTGTKTWTYSSQADVSSEHHNRQCPGINVDSASGTHVQVHSSSEGHDKMTVNAVVNNVERSMSYNALENLQSTRACVTANSTSETEKDPGNSSESFSFSNKSYFNLGGSFVTQPFDSCKKENSLPASTNLASVAVSNNNKVKVNNNLLSDMANAEIQNESGNNSFLRRSIANEHSFPALSDKLDPVIQTDFDYGPCNGCSGPADASSTPKSTPSSNQTVVVHGYQSVNELLDHGNKPEADASANRAFISFHDDVNLITAKPICCKKPQDVPLPACESIIIPAGDGCQFLLSLDQNTWSLGQSTKLEQNSTQVVAQTAHHSEHALSLKNPVLNIFPDIQIDCSYQKV